MSATLWTGIITIIVGLELVRIAMSTWVLHHILELSALGHDDADPQRSRPARVSAHDARRTWRVRAELEGLLDPTLLALRTAADAPDQPQALAAADAALERYLLPLARVVQAGAPGAGEGEGKGEGGLRR